MATKDEKQMSMSERRSSVRVRSLLPCAVRPLDKDKIPELEARILDMAVIESDGVLNDTADWSERTEDLPREVVFVLNEIRALRQQMTEVQRLVERQGEGALAPHWVVINDQGFWIELDSEDPSIENGDYLEVKLRIPSIHTPDILAVGEVVRRDDTEEGGGAAIEFRAISQLHKKAIIRYALRRERQLARSGRFPAVRDDE